MKNRCALMLALCFAASSALAEPEFPPAVDGPPRFGPGGGLPGGPGPQAKIKLLKKFDEDGDKFLNAEERKAALEYLKNERQGRPRRFGPGGFGRQGDEEPAQPGKKITPADVKNYPDAALYDPAVLRTIFIEFDTPDW